MPTARVARAGSDLVVIAYGAMVHTALEATEDLDGAAIEVLDLRSLVPLAAAEMPYFFFPAIGRAGPLRVRALVCVRCPRTGRLRR